MDTGMLWFDNDPKLDFISKVLNAADYYRNKYGIEPNSCYVHPSMIADEKPETGSIKIFPTADMLPHHYWIGVQQPKIVCP